MATLTLRDVPDELHSWLKQQAEAHHRSVNREVIATLEDVRRGAGPRQAKPSVEEIMAIARRFASLPVQDDHSDEEIIGYDENGIPR
jgi:plasmid stability protein